MLEMLKAKYGDSWKLRFLMIREFLLDMMKQRIDESRRLLKAGEVDEVNVLLREADMLREAYDLLTTFKEG